MVTSISFQEFLEEYSSGNRIFDKLAIQADYEVLEEVTIEDTIFTDCIFEVSFSRSVFKHCFFIECNLKTVLFSHCLLEHVHIQGCHVEELKVVDSILEYFHFEDNFAYGCEVKEDYIKKETR